MSQKEFTCSTLLSSLFDSGGVRQDACTMVLVGCNQAVIHGVWSETYGGLSGLCEGRVEMPEVHDGIRSIMPIKNSLASPGAVGIGPPHNQ